MRFGVQKAENGKRKAENEFNKTKNDLSFLHLIVNNQLLLVR